MIAHLLITLATLRAPLAAQTPGFRTSGPLSGIVLDERVAALRPINGLLGATQLGAPIPLPFPITKAAVNLSQEFALVLSNEDSPSLFLVRNLVRGPLTIDRLDLDPSGIDRILLSGDGTTAVLSSPGSLRCIRKLPAAPSIADPVTLAGLAKVNGLAIDNTADSALLIIGGEDENTLARVSLTSGPSPDLIRIADFGPPKAVASTADAFLAVTATGAVYKVDRIGQPSRLDDSVDPTEPAALCAGASTVALVNRATINVYSKEVASPAAVLSLDWNADRCEPLGGNRFVLNGPGTAPLQILDLTDQPQVFFTPAERVEAN